MGTRSQGFRDFDEYGFGLVSLLGAIILRWRGKDEPARLGS